MGRRVDGSRGHGGAGALRHVPVGPRPRGPRTLRGFARRDDGNLMLLAGVIVTIAFITTALTLAQVSSLEREAASSKPAELASEWRFLHERLAANVNVSISTDTKNDTFANTTLPAIAETFRNVQAEKGYDLVLRLAGSGLSVNKTEADLARSSSDPTRYDVWTTDGSVRIDWLVDDKNNGMLWVAPCPDATGPASGCIGAVLLFVRVSDGTSSLEEVMLFPVNRPS